MPVYMELGIRLDPHSSAVCLIHENKPFSFSETSFIDKPESYAYPKHATNHLCAQFGIPKSGISVLSFANKPLQHFDAVNTNALIRWPFGIGPFRSGIIDIWHLFRSLRLAKKDFPKLSKVYFCHPIECIDAIDMHDHYCVNAKEELSLEAQRFYSKNRKNPFKESAQLAYGAAQLALERIEAEGENLNPNPIKYRGVTDAFVKKSKLPFCEITDFNSTLTSLTQQNASAIVWSDSPYDIAETDSTNFIIDGFRESCLPLLKENGARMVFPEDALRTFFRRSDDFLILDKKYILNRKEISFLQ